MRLRIAGIYHFDPGCRASLEDWFRRQVTDAAAQPAFVANEWTESAFQLVRSQRPDFRRLIATEWPRAPSALLDVLEQSLGYEGDAHVAVCPGAEVLWLGTIALSSTAEIEHYSENRLKMYKGFLSGSPLPDDPAVAVRTLGLASRAVAVPDGDTQRDRSLATAIMDRAAGRATGSAAIVVGANHATDSDWSMRRVLEDFGYSCDVIIL